MLITSLAYARLAILRAQSHEAYTSRRFSAAWLGVSKTTECAPEPRSEAPSPGLRDREPKARGPCPGPGARAHGPGPGESGTGARVWGPGSKPVLATGSSQTSVAILARTHLAQAILTLGRRNLAPTLATPPSARAKRGSLAPNFQRLHQRVRKGAAWSAVA